jgi:hypothetical protein
LQPAPGLVVFSYHHIRSSTCFFHTFTYEVLKILKIAWWFGIG